MDLIVRNARLPQGAVVDIAVEEGYIAALGPDLERGAKRELDAADDLVLPAFVNGQLHACKVFWRRQLAHLPTDVQNLPRFEAARRVKAAYTPENVFARAAEAVRLAVANGTCAIRLFADVDEASGLNALKGLLQVKKKYAPFMTVQVVAFPQDGILEPGTRTLMEEALALGADVVGGIPWIEEGEDAQKAHTDFCFELAERFDKDLHVVCDDTVDVGSRTLHYLARQALACGYEGRVSATQCTALAFYDDAYAAEVVALVKKAGITVFANSHVSLVTTPHQGEPYPRGVTRVQELVAAGVPVACAQDDIDNPYYPFGRNDMLEVAQFMAHVGGFGWHPERVLPMVTEVPARLLRLDAYGLKVGCSADFVVLRAADWHEALQYQSPKTHVVLKGRLVAQARLTQRFAPKL